MFMRGAGAGRSNGGGGSGSKSLSRCAVLEYLTPAGLWEWAHGVIDEPSRATGYEPPTCPPPPRRRRPPA